MIKKYEISIVLGLIILLAGIVTPTITNATQIAFSMDTSSLSGTYSLVFDFIDGDADPNNSVKISNFEFGGGNSIVGTETYTCSAGFGNNCLGINGNLSSSINLNDSSDFYNEFIQSITTGSKLSFLLDLTTNFSGGTPDSLVFLLLDITNTPISTDDPLGTNAFLAVNIQSPLDIQIYGNPGFSVTASELHGVPEPSIWALFAIGGFGVMMFVYRKK